MAAPADSTDVSLQAESQLASEEASLWRSFKNEGCLRARETLFDRYAGFSRSIARRVYREQSWGDIEVADLYQLAFAGLLEALDRFDPSRGTPFGAFAAHRIAGNVRDGINRLSEVREQVAWRARAQRERMRSLADNGAVSPQPAIERLAELATGLALGFMLEDAGLFVREERHGASTSAYDSVAWKETTSRLYTELSALPEREQTILRQHYINGVGFDELASMLKLSKGRISQLHRAALVALRKRLRDRSHSRVIR